MKLVKVQYEMLKASLNVIDERGENIKPIHCDSVNRHQIDEFSASYARYNKKMFELLDASVLEHRDDGDPRPSSLAYVADIKKARELVSEYEVTQATKGLNACDASLERTRLAYERLHQL
jgi:hypothetical protein